MAKKKAAKRKAPKRKAPAKKGAKRGSATVTKPKPKAKKANAPKRQVYSQVWNKAESQAENGVKDGVDKIRRYHLDNDELTSLCDLAKTKGVKWVSPYALSRANGTYATAVDVLFELGANKFHDEATVLKAIKARLQKMETTEGKNAWDQFEKRSNSDKKANKQDPAWKIMHSFEVMQRLGGMHPYGLRLAQTGASIDIDVKKHPKDKDATIRLLRLNTQHKIARPHDIATVLRSVKPLNKARKSHGE